MHARGWCYVYSSSKAQLELFSFFFFSLTRVVISLQDLVENILGSNAKIECG